VSTKVDTFKLACVVKWFYIQQQYVERQFRVLDERAAPREYRNLKNWLADAHNKTELRIVFTAGGD